ncbi:MAG: sigma 54-interacting transcriptional regulator [Planctomycetota bacterium]
MGARLWIREPPDHLREVQLERTLGPDGVVIGRDAAADIALNDPAVSRFHVRLVRNEQGWKVVDLGSSNRTFVNGDPVRESRLHPGDHITLGDTELQFIDEVPRTGDASQTQVLKRLGASDGVAAGGGAAQRASMVLNGLYKLARTISQLHDPAQLLDSAMKLLVAEFKADRGAVLLLEGDALVCRAAHSRHGQALRGFVLSQTIYREVVQAREAVLSRDTRADTRFQERESIVGEEIRSVLAAPLTLTSGNLGGILYLDRLQKSDGAGAESNKENSASHEAFGQEDLYGAAVAADFLGAALQASTQVESLEGEREVLVRTIIETHPIIGTSRAIQRVREFIRRAAPTSSTVLIQGETGTGKELVARAIHYSSPRAGHPFVAINCAAIPETLVESELFGHEKGSFTGATARKPGKFEVADHGTVFLDEIGDLPLGCQSKLLRLLEQRCFERVGGTESVHVDVRVVAATHRDLAREAEAGNFREDLFYRLNVLQVMVPPLRERPEDIDLMVEHFLDEFSRQMGGRRVRLSPETQARLLSQPWPGNVRQLRNTLESCVVMASGDTIELSDLPLLNAPRTTAVAGEWLPRSLDEVEHEHIARMLGYVEWNKSKAAELLGIERSTLYARIRNYNLKAPGEK